jgi:hypothetical protein
MAKKHLFEADASLITEVERTQSTECYAARRAKEEE